MQESLSKKPLGLFKHSLFIVGCLLHFISHAQVDPFNLNETLIIKEGSPVALYIPVRGADQSEATYKAEIRDVLGDFQTEEDLHLTIGDAQLKYNIGAETRAITLEFGTNQPGYHNYKIWGFFRHNNGYRYEFKGEGMINVRGGEFYDLYLLSIDHQKRTATVYIK